MFSEEKVNFILEIYNKGKITKKTQKIFRGFGFYIMIWALRDDNIVKENGLTTDKEKIWVLTEKGLNLAKNMKKWIKLNKEIMEAVYA